MSLLARASARLVAAVVLTAAAIAVVPAAPAGAATCSSSSGVSVVVDFHQLGGGVRTACVPGGGGDSASALYPAAGFSLSYVQRQPGFVCQVEGEPAESPCISTPPADAYWGLWWSDGESGSWTYATTSASGLRVPDGGYVALSWNGTSARSLPGVAPTPHAGPSPTPETQPTKQPKPTHAAQPADPSKAPGGTDGAALPSGPVSPSDSTSAGKAGNAGNAGDQGKAGKPRRRHTRSGEPSARPTDSPSAGATDDPDGTDAGELTGAEPDAEPTDSDGGLPAWVAPVVIVVLFGAVGGVALVRRRRSTTP